VEVLADYEDELKASLDNDADDALLCMLADEGDVALMVIEWDGSIYRNENALKKLQAMWRHGFDTNAVLTARPRSAAQPGFRWVPLATARGCWPTHQTVGV
jgi:hypothetical protein